MAKLCESSNSARSTCRIGVAPGPRIHRDAVAATTRSIACGALFGASSDRPVPTPRAPPRAGSFAIEHGSGHAGHRRCRARRSADRVDGIVVERRTVGSTSSWAPQVVAFAVARRRRRRRRRRPPGSPCRRRSAAAGPGCRPAWRSPHGRGEMILSRYSARRRRRRTHEAHGLTGPAVQVVERARGDLLDR